MLITLAFKQGDDQNTYAKFKKIVSFCASSHTFRYKLGWKNIYELGNCLVFIAQITSKLSNLKGYNNVKIIVLQP